MPENRSTTPPRPPSRLLRTARLTGVAYLTLAIAGISGYLVIRNQIYLPDDPEGTLTNLVARAALARWGIAADLLLVVVQAVAALWFFRLFRLVDSFAAGSLTAFGFMNSVAGMLGVVFSVAAVEVAGDPALAPGGDQLATVQLFDELYHASWNAGALFFGLWLIPMGWLTRRSGFLPPALGWILMVGGVGYLVSGFTFQLLPDATVLNEALAGPASVGELWMVGYLLVRGVRATHADLSDAASVLTPVPGAA